MLAMKPLDGTFAQNAERHGVAGLNIDGARIGTDDLSHEYRRLDFSGMGYGGAARTHKVHDPGKLGRWPANLVLDEDAARMLDEQSGDVGNHGGAGIYPSRSAFGGGHVTPSPSDSGGASRFFYCAKASRSDRGEHNTHPTVKPTDLMRWLCILTATPEGGTVLDPFAGSGSTGVAAKSVGRTSVLIELDEAHCEIAARRLESTAVVGVQESLFA